MDPVGEPWAAFAASAPEVAGAGNSQRVDAEDIRSTIGGGMPYSDIDDRHVLYELRIARALWTTWTTPTAPVHRTWTSGRD